MTTFDANSLFQARNREIGQILAHARQQQKKSVSACAAFLATSRRRYRAIERGDVGIEVAELELLLPYLKLSAQAIWPSRPQADVQHRVLRLRPGETLQVIAADKDDAVDGAGLPQWE